MPASRYYSTTAGKMTLQVGVSAVTTGLTVDTTVGLPGSTPFTLLLDAGTSSEEVVTVTQVSGNTLVVKRGEDGTSAQAHANGAVVRHGLTARDLRESREHEAATSGVHGTTSNVVGVNDVQALTNKNLTATTNQFPTSLATTASVTAHTVATAAHGATGAVVGTTNTQTLTNKTLASPQFTGTTTSIGTMNVGDPASSTQYYYRVYKLAQTGANTYEALLYLDNSTTTSRLTNVLKENGTEVGRTSLGVAGELTISGDLIAYKGDVNAGSSTDTAQYVHRTYKKANTGTKYYERLDYLSDPTDGTCNAATVLKENGVEKGRTTLYPDGSFVVNGNLAAANISDSGWTTTGFAMSSGWTNNGSSWRVVNGVVTLQLRFNRSGTAITSNASANVADVQVLTVPSTPRTSFNVTGTGIVLATAGSGGFVYQINNGIMTIVSSTSPSFTWNTNADFYTTLTYLL
jgi:hypothetical protein